MNFNTNKEKILTYILFSYIGGFSLYAGISSNFALTYSLCPLITYFIGHYGFESLVMQSVVKYRLEKKFLKIILTVAYSVFCVYLILGISFYLYENEIFSFMVEPISFGFIYGALYFVYIKLTYINEN